MPCWPVNIPISEFMLKNNWITLVHTKFQNFVSHWRGAWLQRIMRGGGWETKSDGNKKVNRQMLVESDWLTKTHSGDRHINKQQYCLDQKPRRWPGNRWSHSNCSSSCSRKLTWTAPPSGCWLRSGSQCRSLSLYRTVCLRKKHLTECVQGREVGIWLCSTLKQSRFAMHSLTP